MATLTSTITLTSTDATSDALSITISKDLPIGNPSVNIARAAVLHSAPTELLSAAAATAAGDEVYVYIKNMDTTNFVAIKTAGGTDFAKLRAGEFMFLPMKEALGVEAQAHTATCVVEYAYWRRA